MLVDEQFSPEQVAIVRRMTPEQKWKVARQMYWTARSHKKAFILSLHPGWSEEQAEKEVSRIFLNARS
jgi:hypothetical protein